MFKPDSHVFNWPVSLSSGEDLKRVDVALLTLGDQQELTKKHVSKNASASIKEKGEIALMRACISKSTGISVTDLKRLVTPDYTSLQNKVHESMTQTAKWVLEQSVDRQIALLSDRVDKLIDSEGSQSDIDSVNAEIEALEKGLAEFDSDAPSLLLPIEGDDGTSKSGYKLKPPTVAMTDLMDEYADEWKRTLFISQSCSGFTESELMRLSVPDWNQMQARLIDFLGESADYFRRGM